MDLVAIEMIKQLKARYFRFLDTRDLTGLQSVFTASASVDFNGPSYAIRMQGWAELQTFFEQAFSATKYGMHNGHHPEIEVEGEQATGRWYLHDLFINEDDKTVLQGSALYTDRYVKQHGEWLIQHSGYQRLLEVVAPLPEDWQVSGRPTDLPRKQPQRQ